MLPTLVLENTRKKCRRFASLQLLALPAVTSKQVNNVSVGATARSTHPLSKCWLTVRSLVPSFGLMSFQGVGLSLVQMTANRR